SLCHSNVHTTDPPTRRINEFLKVGTVAYVGYDANGLATELADLPLELLGCFRMDHVVDDNAGLLTGQFESDCLADPAVATGDDDNLVLQRHVPTSQWCVGRLATLRYRPALSVRSSAGFVGDLVKRKHDVSTSG